MADNDEVTRPITLYVEKINPSPDIRHIERRRVSVIHIEMSCEAAADIAKYIQSRDCTKPIGSIRIALVGRLVLS